MRDVVENKFPYRRFGKFVSRSIDWNKDKYDVETLLIGTPDEFPKDTKTSYTIQYLNGETAIKFVDPSDK